MRNFLKFMQNCVFFGQNGMKTEPIQNN